MLSGIDSINTIIRRRITINKTEIIGRKQRNATTNCIYIICRGAQHKIDVGFCLEIQWRLFHKDLAPDHYLSGIQLRYWEVIDNL